MLNKTPDSPPKIKPYNGNDSILWSVMIPVYNCFNYIEITLNSVLQQAPSSELMQIEVIDDCSTDGDVEKLVNEVGKGRITYYRQEQNVGSLRNFETCINRSKGKYIHLLHGDDKIDFGFYNEIETLFHHFPQAGAAFTNFRYIDSKDNLVDIENKKILDSPGEILNFIDMIAVQQLIQPPAIVVKRTTYETLGSFFAVHYGEDWEMWTRIASKFPIAYSPKYLAFYRVHHGIGISHNSFITGQNVMDMKKVINIIQNYIPVNKQSKIKKASLEYYAIYCAKVANSLLLDNKDAAFRQIRGAWSISKDYKTLFLIVRFYSMYILRYKQIENLWFSTKKNASKTKLINF